MTFARCRLWPVFKIITQRDRACAKVFFVDNCASEAGTPRNIVLKLIILLEHMWNVVKRFSERFSSWMLNINCFILAKDTREMKIMLLTSGFARNLFCGVLYDLTSGMTIWQVLNRSVAKVNFRFYFEGTRWDGACHDIGIKWIGRTILSNSDALSIM